MLFQNWSFPAHEIWITPLFQYHYRSQHHRLSWTVSYLSHSFTAYNGSHPARTSELDSHAIVDGHSGGNWSRPPGRRSLQRSIQFDDVRQEERMKMTNLDGAWFSHLLLIWQRGGQCVIRLVRSSATIQAYVASAAVVNASTMDWFSFYLFPFCMDRSERRLNMLRLSCI